MMYDLSYVLHTFTLILSNDFIVVDRRGAEISFFPQPLLKLLCKIKQYYCLICFTLDIFPIPNSFLSLSAHYSSTNKSILTLSMPWWGWCKLQAFYWQAGGLFVGPVWHCVSNNHNVIHTSQTLCVSFQMGSVAPWNCLRDLKILARYKINPYCVTCAFLTLFLQKRRALVIWT